MTVLAWKLSAISLLFRQTNILWTAFFCVLNILSRLEREATALKKKDKGGPPPKIIISSYQQILRNAWQTGDVYNPLLAEADIPGGWCLSGMVFLGSSFDPPSADVIHRHCDFHNLSFVFSASIPASSYCSCYPVRDRGSRVHSIRDLEWWDSPWYAPALHHLSR